jgi:hypothetical protein
LNQVGTRSLPLERVLLFQARQVATVTRSDHGAERKPAAQFRQKSLAMTRRPHDEGACRANALHVERPQTSGQISWAQPSVASDVYSAYEYE